MILDLSSEKPRYAQIYEQLRAKILSKELPAGFKLPPSRELANQLGASRSSVVSAYEQLLAEGYTSAKVGAGTFVADDLPALKSRSNPVLNKEFPEATLSSIGDSVASLFHGSWRPWDSLPTVRYDFRLGGVALHERSQKVWRRLIHDCASQNSDRLEHPQGHGPLRRAIAKQLRINKNCNCSEKNIAIVNGSQQAFDLLARLLANPGESIAIETPGYIGAEYLFAAQGLRTVGIPVDEQGMQVAELDQLNSPCKLICVTPSHQFPTGVVMSLSRRLSLIEWAQQHDAYIIEDDYDGEFRYDGPPIESVQGLDQHQRTIYVGTFSKSMFPALRLGYVVLPESLVDAFVGLRWLSDFQTSSLQQLAFTRWIDEGHHDQHLRRMRKIYSERRDKLIHSLGRYFRAEDITISGVNTGMHLLLWLRNLPAEKLPELLRHCAELSVGVFPVTGADRQIEYCGLTLGYAAIETAEIERGISLLKNAIDQCRK